MKTYSYLILGIVILAGALALVASVSLVSANHELVPTCNMNADPGRINPGQEVALSWSSKNATSAFVDQGIGTVPTNHLMTITASKTTTYTATFTGPGGTTTCRTTLEVTSTIGSLNCTISANPKTINPGQSSVLSWSSENTTTGSMDQGIGPVAVSGTRTVFPSQTTIYNISFSGPDGVLNCSATVEVEGVSNLPTCSLSVSPTTVRSGESSILSWSSDKATSAFIGNSIGSVPVDGSRVVSQSQTTTYTGTFSNAVGSRNCTATLFISDVLAFNEKLSITTRVINLTRGETVYSNSTEGSSGERVKFEIRFTARGSRAQDGVTVTNTLPTGLNLISSSVRVDNQIDVKSGNLFGVGRNFGLMSSNQTRVITFEAMVDSFSGSSILTNTATVKSDDSGPVQESATVSTRVLGAGTGSQLRFPVTFGSISTGAVQGTSTLPPRTGPGEWMVVSGAALLTFGYFLKKRKAAKA